ncbi:hypothetical protein C8F01DRAFT_1302559 [Mycena amicta]|nr:hypothetical protein C8F01DRAFT_1302559 [Mycena amicta]
MQFNILSAFILASVALGSVQAAAVVGTDTIERGNGAGSSCTDWEIVPNTADVTALCDDNKGIEQATRLSLGKCFQNTNGVLSCVVGSRKRRRYLCFLQPLPIRQQCVHLFRLQNTNGGTKATDNFNLNNCLSNNNGVLGC